MFRIARKQLTEDAINSKIENENYKDFSLRVKKTVQTMDKRYINATIESFPQTTKGRYKTAWRTL